MPSRSVEAYMSQWSIGVTLLLRLLSAGSAAAQPTVLSAAQKARDRAAAPAVERLLKVHGNDGAILSPDGKTFAFRSDRNGSQELFIADVSRPAAPPRLLVAGPERVASAAFTPDGKAVLFRRDTGADEHFHIWRVNLDGTGLVDLTPAPPLWRDTPMLPRGRADVMVYSARKPDALATSIYVQPLTAGAAARRVATDQGVGTIVDVSPDGSGALFVREAPTGGYDLVEIDLQKGSTRLVSPGHGAMATTGAYSADGRTIFLAHDGGIESHVLVALERDTLRARATYRQTLPASAHVSTVAVSPKGERLAITVSAGNRSFVRILDAHTLRVASEVQAPVGVVGAHFTTELPVALTQQVFAADGAHFVVSLSSPAVPDDVFLVETSTGNMRPLRVEPRGDAGAVEASIEHVTAHDGLVIPLNVYLPARRDKKKLGVIVSFHGGPEGVTPFVWSNWTRVFTQAGYAYVAPNIRGSSGFGAAYQQADDKEKRWNALRDVASVNQWLRRQSWCDPDRLVVYGSSFGGYVVLMALATQPALWKAGVDLAGVTDLTELVKGGPTRYVAELGDAQKDAELLRALSPLDERNGGKIVAPLFVYHGQNDSHVPRAQADAMVSALRRRNVPVEYMVAMNEGHTVSRRENEIEFLTRVLRFLDEANRARR